MPYSTCCGAHTTMPEIGICPDCLDHCDWEDEDEFHEYELQSDKEAENQIEETKISKNA